MLYRNIIIKYENEKISDIVINKSKRIIEKWILIKWKMLWFIFMKKIIK